MTDLTLNELINKFNTISRSLAANEFNYPSLEIKMRMNWEESESVFYASLEQVEIKYGCILIGGCGNGATPEEAMRDYYNQIVGKRLVYQEYRRECVVVG